MREFDERPWGRYTVLEERPGFKVKVLEVEAGARLSLQRHANRAEHWVVVQGVADVVCLAAEGMYFCSTALSTCAMELSGRRFHSSVLPSIGMPI